MRFFNKDNYFSLQALGLLLISFDAISIPDDSSCSSGDSSFYYTLDNQPNKYSITMDPATYQDSERRLRSYDFSTGKYSSPIKQLGVTDAPYTIQLSGNPGEKIKFRMDEFERCPPSDWGDGRDGPAPDERCFDYCQVIEFELENDLPPSTPVLGNLAKASYSMTESVAISGSASDDAGFEWVRVYAKRKGSNSPVQVGTCGIGASASCGFSFTADAKGLSAGQYDIYILAKDFSHAAVTSNIITTTFVDHTPTAAILKPGATVSERESLGLNIPIEVIAADADNSLAEVWVEFSSVKTIKSWSFDCGTPVHSKNLSFTWQPFADSVNKEDFVGPGTLVAMARSCTSSGRSGTTTDRNTQLNVADKKGSINIHIAAMEAPENAPVVQSISWLNQATKPVNDTGIFEVTWNALNNDISNYQLHCSGNCALLNGSFPISNGVSTSRTVTLAASGEATFCVQPYNTRADGTVQAGPLGTGSQCQSINVQLAAPAAVDFEDNLEGISLGQSGGSFTLRWQENDRANYYTLYQKQGVDGSYAQIYKGGDTQTQRVGLDIGSYFYRIDACSDIGECNAGEELQVTVTPPVIQAVSPNSSGTGLVLTALNLDPLARLTVKAEALYDGSDYLYPEHQLSRSGDTLYLSAGTSAFHNALYQHGATVTVTNANGQSASIQAYGDTHTAMLNLGDAKPLVGKDGVVYVGVGSQLHALNAKNGDEILGWPYHTQGDILARPTQDDLNHNLYIGATDDYLHAVATNGDRIWRTQTRGDIVSEAVVDYNDSSVYVGSMDRSLYAMDRDTGNIQWQYPLPGSIDQAPKLYGNGLIYVTTTDGQLHPIYRHALGPNALIWEDADTSDLALELNDSNWLPTQNDQEALTAIGRLLYGLLGRTPKRQELTYWTYVHLQGTNLVDITQSFLNSAEGKLRFPPEEDNQDFLQRLFDSLFAEKDIDTFMPGGKLVADWLVDMNINGMGRAEVAVSWIQSIHYVTRVHTKLITTYNYYYDFCLLSEGCAYDADSDQDGWGDNYELEQGTDPLNPDTDGDTHIDSEDLDPLVHAAPVPGLDPDSEKVGKIQGKISVTEQGSASYQMQFALPSGFGGYQPELGLSYSSLGDNGVAGVGWNITGISQIARCRRLFEEDNFYQAVEFTSDDALCLDGQRLKLVSGTHFHVGAVYAPKMNTQTRVEIKGSANALYFEAKQPNGDTWSYGLHDAAVQADSASGVRYRWKLSRKTNTFGQHIDYAYSGDNSHELMLDSVSYAGNRVQFYYTSRSDGNYHFFRGNGILDDQLLTQVEVINHHNQVLNRYELEHSLSRFSSRNLLTQLRRCSGDISGACLQPTTFSYQDDIPFGFSDEEIELDLTKIFPGIENQGEDKDYVLDIKLADTNGDGVKELFLATVLDDVLHVKSLNVEDFSLEGFHETGETRSSTYRADGKDIKRYQYIWHPRDLDADGIDEIFISESPVKADTYLDLTGDGIPDNVMELLKGIESSRVGGHSQGSSWECSESTSTSASDINYDGLMDRQVTSSGTCVDNDGYIAEGETLDLYINTTVGSDYSEQRIHRNDNYDYLTHVGADINGDGYPDDGLKCNKGNHKVTDCTEFFNYEDRSATFIDFNGDGLRDQFYRQNGRHMVLLAQLGDSTINKRFHLLDAFPKNGLEAIIAWPDLDGDGIPARLYSEDYSNVLYIRHDANTENKVPDLLLNVEDGLGTKDSFEYKKTSDSSVYTQGESKRDQVWGSGSPIFNAKPGMTVVSRHTRTQGLNANGEPLSTSIDYHYKGQRFQSGGRGSLGFAEVSSTDTSTGITTTKTFRQDYPFNGQLSGQESRYQGQLLSKMTVDEWQSIQLNDNHNWFVAPKTTTTTKYGVNRFDGVPGASVIHSEIVEQSSFSVLSDGVQANGYVVTSGTTVTTTDHLDNYAVTTKSVVLEHLDEDTIAWRINRPTLSTTTLSHTGQESVVQTRQLSYSDDHGRLEKEQRDPNSEDVTLYSVSHYVYSDEGNLTEKRTCSKDIAASCKTQTPTMGTASLADAQRVFKLEKLTFDEEGRYLVSESNGMFTTASYGEFNRYGQPGVVTNATGGKAWHYYDAFGARYFSLNNTGDSVHITKRLCAEADHCPANAVYMQESTAPHQPDARTYYDMAGREVATATTALDGRWVWTRSEYNVRGRLVRKSAPYYTGNTVYYNTFAYDDLDRLWKETKTNGISQIIDISGGTQTFKLDLDYSDAYQSTAIYQVRSETKNAQGQLIETLDALDNTTAYSYDAQGNLNWAKGVDDKVVTLGYDAYGRKLWMKDPDKGHIQYGYNAIGEQVSRTAPDGGVELSFVDVAGRVVKTQLTSDSGNRVNRFYYEGTALLQRAEVDTHAVKEYGYDRFGRATSTRYTYFDNVWETKVAFDGFGRVSRTWDASGAGRGLSYTYLNGYMHELREGQNDNLYYRAGTMDAWGNIDSWTLGNGQKTAKVFDQKTGFLTSIFAGDGQIQAQDYRYDGLGNLRLRTDQHGGLDGNTELVENFYYDDLNRLDKVDFAGAMSLDVDYYANGNIKTKSDVYDGAQYQYGEQQGQCATAPGAHALTGIGNRTRYCYDSRGNQTHSYEDGVMTRQVSYTGFDKPASIWSQEGQTWFKYGVDNARIRRIDTDSEGSTTTYYVGGDEILHHDSGLVEYKRYIDDFAIDTVRSNGTQETVYLYKDHIGSISVITDSQGNIQEKLSFDVFGQRRDAASWNEVQRLFGTPTLDRILTITQRGFTGHEHIDHADVIHMNGRIYDPVLGRFMQADPIVQAPNSGQSLNRYTYVFNNPLSYTDPTGYTSEANCELYMSGWGRASCGPDQLTSAKEYVMSMVAGEVPAEANPAGEGVSQASFDNGNTAGTGLGEINHKTPLDKSKGYKNGKRFLYVQLKKGTKWEDLTDEQKAFVNVVEEQLAKLHADLLSLPPGSSLDTDMVQSFRNSYANISYSYAYDTLHDPTGERSNGYVVNTLLGDKKSGEIIGVERSSEVTLTGQTLSDFKTKQRPERALGYHQSVRKGKKGVYDVVAHEVAHTLEGVDFKRVKGVTKFKKRDEARSDDFVKFVRGIE